MSDLLALRRLSDILMRLPDLGSGSLFWKRTTVVERVEPALNELLPSDLGPRKWRKVLKGEARLVGPPRSIDETQPIAAAEDQAQMAHLAHLVQTTVQDTALHLHSLLVKHGLADGSPVSQEIAAILHEGTPLSYSPPHFFERNLAQASPAPPVAGFPVHNATLNGDNFLGREVNGQDPDTAIRALLTLGKTNIRPTTATSRERLAAEQRDLLTDHFARLDRDWLLRIFHVDANNHPTAANSPSGVRGYQVTGDLDGADMDAALQGVLHSALPSSRYELANLEIYLDQSSLPDPRRSVIVVEGVYNLPNQARGATGPLNWAKFRYHLVTELIEDDTHEHYVTGQIEWARNQLGALPADQQELLWRGHLQRVLPFFAQLGFSEVRELRWHSDDWRLNRDYPGGVDYELAQDMDNLFHRLGFLLSPHEYVRFHFDLRQNSHDWVLLFNRHWRWEGLTEGSQRMLSHQARVLEQAAYQTWRDRGRLNALISQPPKPILRLWLDHPEMHGETLARWVEQVFADPPTTNSDPRYLLARDIYRVMRWETDRDPNSLLYHSWMGHLNPDLHPDEMRIPLTGVT